MKENILMTMVVISLVLSTTAVVLEVKDEFSLIEPSKIKGTAWTSSNDGSGSELDADKIDNLDSSQFLRNDATGIIDGDLYVNGSILHKSQYRYCTISAGAFTPISENTRYGQFGSILYPNSLRPESNIFYAPIQLPDGAKITKLMIQYTKMDISALFKLILEKRNYTSGLNQMYTFELPLREDFYSKPFESDNLSVDISNYDSAYNLCVIMEIDNYSDAIFNWVTIEYTVTSSLP